MKHSNGLVRRFYLILCWLFILASASLSFEWYSAEMPLPQNFNHVTLKIDGSGNPHLLYEGINDNDIYYTYFDGEEWNTVAVNRIVEPPVKVEYRILGRHSLALDSQGHPHIAYIYATMVNGWWKDALIYAYHDGDRWHSKIVDSQMGDYDNPSSVYNIVSVAVDSDNRPYIAYMAHYSKFYLMLAHWNGTGWEKEQVRESWKTYKHISMSVASNGTVGIAFVAEGSSDYNLVYVKKVGDQWDGDIVGTWDNIKSVSLTFDSNSNPHIVFVAYDGSDYYVKHAYNDGIEWKIEEIVNSTGTFPKVSFYSVSVSIDAQDRVHVAFSDTTGDGSLVYAFCDNVSCNDTWFVETVVGGWVATGAGVDSGVALDLSETGIPQIAYVDVDKNLLKLISKTDGTWGTAEVVDVAADPNKCEKPFMELDSEGNPHLVCVYQGDIRYVYWDGNKWDVQIVPGADGGDYPVLDIDSSGNPHIAFRQGSTPIMIKYAHWNGTAWENSTVESSNVTWPTPYNYDLSITVDQDDLPYVVFIGIYNGSNVIKYARPSGSGWETYAILGNYSAQMPSADVDSQNHLHIVYYDSSNGSLKKVWYDGGGWQWVTVGSADNNIAPQMVLDSDDVAHIVYVSGGNVTYAKVNAYSVLSVEEIASGTKPAVALSSGGNPSIVYLISGGVKYTYFNGTLWSSPEQVSSISNVEGRLSLGVDQRDEPFAVFYDANGGTLYYAYPKKDDFYKVTVSVNGSGAVVDSTETFNCSSGECYASFKANSTVVLEAKPESGFYPEWSGDCDSCGYSSNCSIVIEGNKTCNVNFVELPPEAPDISVSPVSYDFGNVQINSTEEQVFVVQNIGGSELNIREVSINGTDLSEFSISEDNCNGTVLAPEGNCTVTVVFKPSSGGLKTAYLRIASNDPDNGTIFVNLSGNGTEITEHTNNSPVIEDFSVTPESGTAPLTVTFSWSIYDPDNDTLTCYIDVNNDGENEYSIDNCSSEVSQSYTYGVAGTYTAKLEVCDGNRTVSETVIVEVSNRPSSGYGGGGGGSVGGGSSGGSAEDEVVPSVEEHVKNSIEDVLGEVEDPEELGEAVEEMVSQALEQLSPEEVDDLAADVVDTAVTKLKESGEVSAEKLSKVTESVVRAMFREEVGGDVAGSAVRKIARKVLDADIGDYETKGEVIASMLKAVLEEAPEDGKSEVADDVVAEVLSEGDLRAVSKALTPVIERNVRLDLTDELAKPVEVAGEELEVVDPAVVAPLVKNAFEKTVGLSVNSRSASKVPVVEVSLPQAGVYLPLAPVKVQVTPEKDPGIHLTVGGLVAEIVDESHIATAVVPLTPDLETLSKALGVSPSQSGSFSGGQFASAVSRINVDEETGSVELILTDGSRLEAYFGWGLYGTDATSDNVTLDEEAPFDLSDVMDRDPADPKYRLYLNYINGAKQAIAPAVAKSKDFVEWLESFNVTVNVHRETGVVHLELSNGVKMCVKASYLVVPLSETDIKEFTSKALKGFYVRYKGDVNGDGYGDYELWSNYGKQLIWGLPCP